MFEDNNNDKHLQIDSDKGDVEKEEIDKVINCNECDDMGVKIMKKPIKKQIPMRMMKKSKKENENNDMEIDIDKNNDSALLYIIFQ